MKYIKANISYRYATFDDLFVGDMITGRGTQFLKENIEYFIFQNNKLHGTYRTPRRSDLNIDICSFTEMYLAVCNQLVMVPNEQEGADTFVSRTFLQKIEDDALEKNTKFFLYINKSLSGPYFYQTENPDNKTAYHLSKGEVFVLYKTDKC